MAKVVKLEPKHIALVSRDPSLGSGARLDPEVRSWIQNVIVPAIVSEYLAERGTPNSLAEPTAAMPECEPNGRLSAEGIQ